jgi:hypothetical protein
MRIIGLEDSLRRERPHTPETSPAPTCARMRGRVMALVPLLMRLCRLPAFHRSQAMPSNLYMVQFEHMLEATRSLSTPSTPS